ncbi:hypothetical protein COOONC_23910, partial [Cooperia oncophora]
MVQTAGMASCGRCVLSVMSYPEYHDRCRSIAKKLCHTAISALEPMFVKDRNSGDNSFFMEQIRLFWEVYQLTTTSNLLQPEEISSLNEMLDKIVLLLCETGIDQKSRNFLPAEFLRLVDKEQEPTVVRSHTTKQLPYFLKDLSVSHSPSVSIVPCESTKNRNDFIRRIDNVLDDILTGNSDVSVMHEIGKAVVNESICAGDAESFIKLTTRIVSAMDTILASSLEVVSAFFAMFEKLFCSLPEDVKLPVMKRFYEAWHDKYGNLPSLGKHLKNFDIDVTECVNGIGDHVEIQNNFSKFKKVRDKLSFYLLTNPLPTLHRLLIQTLDNKLVVPGVLNIFRHCSVLFEQVYRSEKVPPQVKSVLLSCIISIFEEEAHR